MRRRIVLLVSFLAATALAPLTPSSAAAASPPPPLTYAPPVPEPPSDLFRPPTNPYGPGNRGIDYTTSFGEPVAAAADGVVAFAGQVAGALHVVIRHADGLRTSYSFLASVVVTRGQSVVAGQTVGVSGGSLHFGIRAGSTYLDPLVVMARPLGGHAHLVPDDGSPLGSEHDEQRGLLGSLRGLPGSAARVGRAAVAGAAAAAADAGHLALADEAIRLAAAVAIAEARSLGRSCTPPATPAPVLVVRHLAVLVAGLGSSTGDGAVLQLPTATFGYAPGDVYRYSYRGGAATDPAPYGPSDTLVDLHLSAERLRTLLRAVIDTHPGLPVDVLAHSQGGLVAYAALAQPPPIGGVTGLVTLGAPFHGADLATGAALVGHTAAGAELERGAAQLPAAGGVRADGRSVRQMAQTSDFVRWLLRLSPPPGLTVTSIAARGDLVVPSPRSWLDGATNVIVDVGGLTQHSRLPGSSAAAREVALAVTGHPPTCRDPLATAEDAVAGEAITVGEDLAGVAVAASTAAVDLDLGRG